VTLPVTAVVDLHLVDVAAVVVAAAAAAAAQMVGVGGQFEA